MDDTVKAVLAEPDRFIGGTLINYHDVQKWPRDREGKKLPFHETGFGKTTIRKVQLEDLQYFAVLGTIGTFSCNGDIATLRAVPNPRFPLMDPDEIAFAGANNHEWHIIPKR